MSTTICYHSSRERDRDSILESGLLPRRPGDDGETAAEQWGNEAGAAVYLWRYWGDNHLLSSCGMDVWAVELADHEISRDPSNLGPMGAVYVVGGAAISPERLRLVSPAGRSGAHDLKPADMRDAQTALAWSLEQEDAATLAMCDADPSLHPVWLGQWDEDDEAYREAHLVALAADDVPASEVEWGDVRQMVCRGPRGALTLHDLLVALYPLHCVDWMQGWEYALMAPAADAIELWREHQFVKQQATAQEWAHRWGATTATQQQRTAA
jgi:hypothetical protein